ncbi:MAG: LD-carboxypeptidase [Cryomorphaceae bacterium]|nr:LD-carboxypeptidase [Cryomorphaceae bacterium]
MIQPPFLTPGDTIYITAPAKAIEETSVLAAKNTLETWGLNVRIAPHCLGRYHYFSGSDEQRLADFQDGLDDPSIKAILCARGGYGCVRMVEALNWDAFRKNPTWIIGFSDVTVFHQQIHQLGIESIHGIMPLGFIEGSDAAKETLKKSLFGESFTLEAAHVLGNIRGEAHGNLVGGNMAIVTSLLGTSLSYSFKNNILVLEDIGEHVYKIDRMLYSLRLAGVFQEIKGLVLGGFTDMEDTDVPFGKTIKDLILEQVQDLGIPVAFNLPFGHISDNQALVLGRSAILKVTETKTTLLI